jgi:DNA helicase-2/ATP-dependent DNA helicase PcrA
MSSNYLDDLTLIKKDKFQEEAFDSETSTVVIAGPGSGKTRVLALKAIKIKDKDIYPPTGLVCITYSRETVRELLSRLKYYSFKANKYDFIGTIHSFCLTFIIKPYIYLYPEYKIESDFKIADNELLLNTLLECKKELQSDEIEKIDITTLNKHRSLALNGKSEYEYTPLDSVNQLSELFEIKLKEKKHLDFISIVNISTKILREKEFVLKTLEAKFPWILIDEYQDLGRGLHEIVLELHAQTDIKFFIVGDTNQSIYGFNGAYPDFLEEIYKNDDFKSIKLISNYRSNQDIIDGSLSTLYMPPPLPDYKALKRTEENAEFSFILCDSEIEDQYKTIVTKILPKLINKGVQYSEIGILTASGNQINQLSKILEDYDIPHYKNKWDFNFTDFLECFINCSNFSNEKYDDSFSTLFNFWNVKKMEALNLENSNDSEIENKIFFYNTLLNSKDFVANSGEWIEFMENQLDFELILKNCEFYDDEMNNYKIFKEKFLTTKNIPLSKFLYLRKPNNEITLTTRHSSKGLEFEAIIMIGMEQGKFPNFNIQENSPEMEEQNRICYVCISRAKKECILLYSEYYTTYSAKFGKSYTHKQQPSKYWNLLVQRFGTDKNMFKADTYN